MGYAGFDLPVRPLSGAEPPAEEQWEQAWGEVLDDLEAWIEARLRPAERGLFDIVSELFEFKSTPPSETLDFLFGDWVPVAVFAGSHWYRAAVLARAEALTERLERVGLSPDLQALRAVPEQIRLYIRETRALAVDAPDASEAASWEGTVALSELDDQDALDALSGARCRCGVCSAGRS